MSGVLFVIVDQTAEAANEDWVFPGRKRSRAWVLLLESRSREGTVALAFAASKNVTKS